MVDQTSNEPTTSEPATQNQSRSSPLSTRPPAGLFPLRLTPFEKYMLEDDLPGYPRVFSVLLEFEGRLDPAVFKQAAREVINRHPLLTCVVQKVGRDLSWVHIEFPDDQLLFREGSKEPQQSQFNIRQKPGTRMSGWTDGRSSEILIELHHAICDGQGARRVILDLTSLYASIISPGDPNIRIDQLDYERLRCRGTFAKESVVARNPIPNASNSLWQRFRHIYEFVSNHPVPIRPVPGDKISPKAKGHHYSQCRFERDEVRRFRDRVRGSRFSINDVAIALLLNTIARWNRKHGETGGDRLYRLLVPVDLRETGDESLPATNRMSFIFLTRPTSLCLDLSQLLHTIRDEMNYIEEHGSKYNLLRALPIVQSVPGLVPLGIRIPVCFSSAVLTNVGNVLRRQRSRYSEERGHPVAGNLRFLRSLGVPPLRPKTRVGIGMTISLDEITLQSQMDSFYFSQESAESFLQFFAENWRRWVGANGESTPD